MENVFGDLKIADVSILDAADQRNACSKCGRSRKYFCYTCFIAVGKLEGQLPSVKLPIKVDIIKHPGERDGKSTACHAAVLASDDVTIYTYPCIPEYQSSQVILVFPGDGSVSLETLAQKRSTCHRDSQHDPHTGNLGDFTIKDTNTSSISEEVDNVNSVGETLDGTVYRTVTKDNSTDGCMNNDADRKRKAVLSNITKENSKDSCTNNKDDGKRKAGHVDGEQSEQNEDDAPEKKESGEMYEPAAKKTKTKPVPSFSKVVFIDSTWKQATSIFQDERLSDLRRVEIKSHKTKFWRSQDRRPDTYLSTIEALYYLMCEYHELYLQEEYEGQYDNLLFFFSYMCNQIRFSKQKRS